MVSLFKALKNPHFQGKRKCSQISSSNREGFKKFAVLGSIIFRIASSTELPIESSPKRIIVCDSYWQQESKIMFTKLQLHPTRLQPITLHLIKVKSFRTIQDTGITNLGSTCYAASLIQTLLSLNVWSQVCYFSVYA